jgi:endonuclease III
VVVDLWSVQLSYRTTIQTTDTLHLRQLHTLVRRNTKGQLPSANIDLQPQGAFMPRGIVPRQPAKTGRQDRATGGRVGAHKTLVKTLPHRAAELLPKTGRARAPVPPARDKRQKAGARSYNPLAPERITEILKRLDQQYPNATCALSHANAWELLVATILSAQSTDVGVNKVTPVIFKKYPTVQDFAALKSEELEPDIRSTGFFRNKSKSVVGAAKKIVSDFGGEVPCGMDQLLTLPGVARKTANVVLGTWFGKNEGLVVDTHVQRVSRRLELTRNEDPKKIEQDLMQVIPREKWTLFSHQIIWHGRKLCMARAPKCADCPLENICHAADKTWSTVEIHKNAK